MFIPEQERVRALVKSLFAHLRLCFGQGFFCMYSKQQIIRLLSLFAISGIMLAGAFFSYWNTGEELRPNTQTPAATTAIAETPSNAEGNIHISPEENETVQGTLASAPTVAVPKSETITLSVGTASYTAPWTRDMTVLDAMRTLSREGALSFTTKEFPGLGAFVEEISGKRRNGSYWILT